jgi:hypothetical protein
MEPHDVGGLRVIGGGHLQLRGRTFMDRIRIDPFNLDQASDQQAAASASTTDEAAAARRACAGRVGARACRAPRAAVLQRAGDIGLDLQRRSPEHHAVTTASAGCPFRAVEDVSPSAAAGRRHRDAICGPARHPACSGEGQQRFP